MRSIVQLRTRFHFIAFARNAEALAIIKSAPERLHDAHAAVYVALVLVEETSSTEQQDYIAYRRKRKLHLKRKSCSKSEDEGSSGTCNSVRQSRPPPRNTPL